MSALRPPVVVLVPIRSLLVSVCLFAWSACAFAPAMRADPKAKTLSSGPPYRLSVQVVDDLGKPARGTFVRVMECCHTRAGPCGRVPVDNFGKTSLDVCPDQDGIVRVTLTPDPKHYRVPPISEFEVQADATVSVTVTRHEKVLQRLLKN